MIYGLLNYFTDIDTHRTTLYASAATAAGDNPVMDGWIVAELVAYAVFQPVGFGGPRIMAACLHGELG